MDDDTSNPGRVHDQRRNLPQRLQLGLLALVTVGVILSAVFGTFPLYGDPNWRSGIPQGDSQSYFAAQEANRTFESRAFDVAVGATVFFATLLGATVVLKVQSLREFRYIQTPARAGALFIVTNATVLMFSLASGLDLVLGSLREEFPPWADSLGIPLPGVAVFAVILAVLSNLGLVFMVLGVPLPVSLWTAPVGFRGWTASVALGIVALIALAYLVGILVSGVFLFVLPILSTLYVALCVRATGARPTRRIAKPISPTTS